MLWWLFFNVSNSKIPIAIVEVERFLPYRTTAICGLSDKYQNHFAPNKTLVIDKRFCPQNHACPILRICPAGAILQNGYGLPVIDAKKCSECGKCMRHCPMNAVHKA